jgi:GNAT superfamily N-acetyltransferase
VKHHRQDRPNGPRTDATILQNFEIWVHVPPSGVLDEDSSRLLVHLPTKQGTSSRVWRSRPDRRGAEALILRTIEAARAAGASRLVWHTGSVSPPPVDDLLPQHGFEKTEDLDVLAFELGTQREPKLPDLRVPAGVRAWLVRDEPDLQRANAVEAAVSPASSWDRADTRAYLLGLSNLVPGQGRQDEALSHVLRYLASVRNPENEGWEDAATAGAEVAGQTVRLWGAGTLPGHRGRGAYRALVMERCRHAQALGATLALAKANTSSSSPILRAAGFRRVATERRYALKMPAPRNTPQK